MRLAIAAIAALAAGLAHAADADGSRLIGVAAPLSGPSATLGRQVVDGANIAATGLARLEIADDACTGDGGAAAARRFVEARVAIVVGFLCAEAIEAALPILKQAAIAVVTPGVRVDSLTDRRERTGYLVYRLAPRDDDEAAAVSELLGRNWRDQLIAIIDDGTIYGRSLAEALRATLETTGMKPVFIDTYRPQMENQIGLVGRLRRAGATHVFVGGDRDDIAVMARDAAGLGAGIVFAGGESLRTAPSGVPLSPGVLMVGLPEWSDLAEPQALQRIAARGVAAEGYVLPAYAAVQVALQSLASPQAIAGPIPTAIGPVEFDDKGDLARPLYRLFSFDGTAFRPTETQ